jgi:transcriptional regulator with XRE-family HTH domain
MQAVKDMFDTFELRLAHLLVVRGLTQGEFARGLEASPTFISNMIRGTKKPGLEFLSRLATQYQVSLDWLLLGRGQIDGASTMDGEWFRIVVLRVELARLAAEGLPEALILVKELLGRAPTTKSSPVERQALLDKLSKANEKSALVSNLYNGFVTHPDSVIRAREVLSAALVHFQSSHADPLAAMVASRDSATTSRTELSPIKTIVKQKIKGLNVKNAGHTFIDHK